MATKLTDYPAAPGLGRYDCAAPLDGSTWDLAASADFVGRVTSTATNAARQPAKCGRRVRIRHSLDQQPERLVHQFRAG